MTADTVIQKLRAMQAAAEPKQAELIGHAIDLIENMGHQMESLKALASRPYRASSEKIAPGQMTLDFISQLVWQAHQDADGDKSDTDEADDGEANDAPGAGPGADKSPRRKRRSKVKLLPVVRKDVALAAAACQCAACGATKVVIGTEVSRRIVYEPAKLYMLEEHLQKVACRPCGNGIVLATATPKRVPGSLASSSLLAHLVVAKVVDALPIERIGKQLARHGGELATSTLYDWFASAGDAVAMLMPRLRDELLRSQLISLDDTPVPTQNRAHARNIQRGRLYGYIADVDRLVVCDFAPDWKGSHPRRMLADFQGDVQGDGYKGIDPLFASGASPPRRVGCNDHARRKFVEALKLGDGRAKPIIELYARLYAVERQAAGRPAPQRAQLRAQAAWPVWQQLASQVEALAPIANRRGPLGKAVTYWRAQRPTLQAYLGSGHLPISNAHVERLLRTVALMRKNSLFFGSLDAGPRYAALLTMAANCALCGANPFDYFVWLFDRLAEGWPAKRSLELLPQRWLADRQQHAA